MTSGPRLLREGKPTALRVNSSSNWENWLRAAGSGSGLRYRAHLQIFLREALNVVGLDMSPYMLRIARQRLGKRVPLLLGDAENLPFKERSFDCVTLIATLKFIPEPEKAIHEALRVSGGNVLLGVLNKYSPLGITRRLKGIFRQNLYSRARYYSIGELRRLMATLAPEAAVDWASILVLPMSLQRHLAGLERRLSFRRNPFAAFLGLVV